MKVAIHWFRRDLRLTDNTALAAAAEAAEGVVPVYVQSPWRGSHHWTGPHRQEFLCGSLAELDENMRALGNRLVVRRGEAVEELARLAREVGAGAVFCNRDPDPFGRGVEERLGKELAGLGVELQALKDVCLHERDEVLTKTGGSFRVFTPYGKAWLKLEKPAPGPRLRALPPGAKIAAGPRPAPGDWKLRAEGKIIAPGEAAAQQRLARFLEGPIERYAAGRDLPAAGGSSRLSQDLRWGLLSIREVFARCRAKAEESAAEGRRNVHVFVSELIWREFYQQVLWKWPEVLEQDFNPKFRAMRWPGTDADFARWRNAETGFPIVDAALRELAETGFMPNRARMITAMFLTKDLLVHWRRGESHFLQQLTDGEIASNNGGWQWSAGTGADAAPYFRIQNPWAQTARFDAKGEYIRRWLPELRDVPVGKLTRAPADGAALARGYPAPMVDHAQARERALGHFLKFRRGGGS